MNFFIHKLKIMKYYTNLTPPESKPEELDPISKTQPGQALEVAQIIENYSPLVLGQYAEHAYYDADDDSINDEIFEDGDLTDIDRYKHLQEIARKDKKAEKEKKQKAGNKTDKINQIDDKTQPIEKKGSNEEDDA